MQITGGYANGQDLLEFTNQLGITGVFTPATGLMTLSGSASPGNYQTALRAVTYRNPSDNPLTSPRTVTFRVDDGGSPNNLSSPVTRNIAVTAVNDAPVITGQNPVATPEDTARAIGFADLLATDPDNAYPAAFTLTVANGTNYTHVGNTITPASNFNGVLTVPVTVNDGTANSNSFNLQVTVTPVNDNPVAGPDSIERYPTQSTKVKVTALLANDSDPDGDTPLAITAVGAPASGLASVSLGGGYVFYTPNAGFTAADTFTYTLADGHGGTAIGTVTVTIHADALPAQNVMKMELLGNGSARISFAAIPGRTYRVQSIDNLASVNWVDRFTGAADAQGLLQFTDPPPLPPQRFYRTITP